MAGRATYTEEDKARVFVALTANGGNIKRTSRETETPENTVRRWKHQWEAEGPPPEEVVASAVTNFATDAERVRNKALLEIERKLPEAKVGELNAVVGTLTDKINLIMGLATSRQEHVMALPSPDELRAILGPAVQAAIGRAASRQDDIVDAELVEPAAIAAHKALNRAT